MKSIYVRQFCFIITHSEIELILIRNKFDHFKLKCTN